MPTYFEKVCLCDVRRVDKLVVRLLMTFPTVILHDSTHDSALRVKYGKS